MRAAQPRSQSSVADGTRVASTSRSRRPFVRKTHRRPFSSAAEAAERPMLPDPAPRAARRARRAPHPQPPASSGACQTQPVAAPRASTQASGPARDRRLENACAPDAGLSDIPQPRGRVRVAHGHVGKRRQILPGRDEAGGEEVRREQAPVDRGGHQRASSASTGSRRRAAPPVARVRASAGRAPQCDAPDRGETLSTRALGATIEERWLPAALRVGVRAMANSSVRLSRAVRLSVSRVSGERRRCDGLAALATSEPSAWRPGGSRVIAT